MAREVVNGESSYWKPKSTTACSLWKGGGGDEEDGNKEDIMRQKVYIVYMYRYVQNHTDILKILFYLQKYALGKDKWSYVL
jgi:hypothetical protein